MRWLGGAILATLIAAPAQAAPRVQVAPVIVEIGAKASVASFRLRNTSDQPAAFTVLALRWTQDNGETVLTPTTEIIVSPPAFVVQPGAVQIVRIGLKNSEPRSVERAYRMILSETPLETARNPGALRMRLELSLPVFAAPNAPGKGEIVIAAEGKQLRIANPSNRHVRLMQLDMDKGDIKTPLADLPRYLLAGGDVVRDAPTADAVTLTYAPADAAKPLTRTYALGAQFPVAALP